MANFYTSPSGSDSNPGSQSQPFKTLAFALTRAQPLDNIRMFGGAYAGGARVTRPNITIAAMPGEMPVISLPTSDPAKQVVITADIDANNTTLRGLTLQGGYNYCFQATSSWDSGAQYLPWHGPKSVTLDTCAFRDSGDDLVKFAPASHNGKILKCLLSGSGKRDSSNAQAVDFVQCHDILIQDCIITDVFQGIYGKGGSRRAVIERNRISGVKAGHGIGAGQVTSIQWFDPADNPFYFESIDFVVRNNIITGCSGAGIFIQQSAGAKVYHNTLLDVMKDASLSSWGGITISGGEYYTEPGSIQHSQASQDATIRNNVCTVLSGRDVFRIRLNNSLGYIGTPVMKGNCWWGGSGPAKFTDERSTAGTITTPEPGSLVSDPRLLADWTPGPGSPCPGLATADYLNSLDFYSRQRSGRPSSGACEPAAATVIIDTVMAARQDGTAGVLRGLFIGLEAIKQDGSRVALK